MSRIRDAIDFASGQYHDSTRWDEPIDGRGGPTYDNMIDAAIKDQEARIAELEAGIKEYLSEYDTPAKDYAYRAQCRDRLRRLIS